MKLSYNKFEAETREKWGKTDTYKEYSEKTENYSEDKWKNINDGLNNIFKDFSVCKKNGEKPQSDIAQSLVKKLQSYITDNYYTCTTEILAGLGQMYVLDERFRENIDKNGDGTAEFIRAALKLYCK